MVAYSRAIGEVYGFKAVAVGFWCSGGWLGGLASEVYDSGFELVDLGVECGEDVADCSALVDEDAIYAVDFPDGSAAVGECCGGRDVSGTDLP